MSSLNVWLWRMDRAYSQEPCRTGGNRDFTPKRHIQSLKHTGTQRKSSNWREPGPDQPAGFGQPPGEAGVAVAHTGGTDTVDGHAGEHPAWWTLLLLTLNILLAPRPSDLSNSLWTSGQTTNCAGTQPHPSHIGCLENSELKPLDSPLDAAQPTRGPRQIKIKQTKKPNQKCTYYLNKHVSKEDIQWPIGMWRDVHIANY